jgi:YegS/Rv2252/BmrU family lipid kinase
VIFNPTAGRRRRKRFEATLAALRAAGCGLELRETSGPGDAENLARAASGADGDVVVAAGGDGTVNEVVNGLVGPDASGEPLPLGILPLGTANVLAAEIGLDLRPDSLARTIAQGPIRPICLGRAGTRCFTMMAGGGFDAHVVAGVNTALKRWIGKGAYVWESARQLRRFGFPDYRVILDGVERHAASVIVAKGRHYGGRFVCAPAARLEDPGFQVCLFERRGAWNALRYAAALVLGRLRRLPDVEVVAAREVRIDGPHGDPLQGDGDVIGHLPIVIRVLPDALRLVMPTGRR